MYNFKEFVAREDRLAPGHRMCAGCGGTIAVRNVLKAIHPGVLLFFLLRCRVQN